jgi:hypothetical protein
MAFTALLGTDDSELGNIILGFGGVVYSQSAADTISLTESANKTVSWFGASTDKITITDVALAPSVFTKSTSETITFTESPIGGLVLEGNQTDLVNFTEAAKGKVGEKATDILNFTESTTSELPLAPIASDSWTITESAIKTLVPAKTVFDKLTFIETVLAQTGLLRQNAEIIFFTESAKREAGTVNASGSDSMSLTDSGDGLVGVAVNESITLTDDAVGEVSLSASDTFELTEIAIGVGRQIVVDTLIFTEKSKGNKTRSMLPVADFFLIADSARGSHLHTVESEDTFTITDEAVKTRYVRTKSELFAISDVASNSPSWQRVTLDKLAITEYPVANVIYKRSATDTLTINETRFDPTEGVYIGGVRGVLVRDQFVLRTGSGDITLPRPEFGDSENTTNEFNLRYARTGQVYTTVRRRRLNRRLVYTFNLRRRQERELVQFLSASNDKFMYSVNWKGEEWKLKLLSNPIQSNNIGFDRVRVELEFEGIQLTSGGVTTCQC